MTANRKAELKAQLAKARHTRSAREAIDIVTKVLSEVISALDTTILGTEIIGNGTGQALPEISDDE